MIMQIVACCAWCGAHLNAAVATRADINRPVLTHRSVFAEAGSWSAQGPKLNGVKLTNLIPLVKEHTLNGDVPLGVRPFKGGPLPQEAADSFFALIPSYGAHQEAEPVEAPVGPGKTAVLAAERVRPETWTGPSANTLPSIEKPKRVTVTPKSPPKKDAENTICSINVSGAKVADVISQLTDMTHVNVVLVASTESAVTLHMTNVHLIDILKNVCLAAGLAYLKVGDSYVIATVDKLKEAYPKEWEALHPAPEPVKIDTKQEIKEEIVMRAVPMNYADANQVATTLKALYGQDTNLLFSASAAATGPTGGAQGTTTAAPAASAGAAGGATGSVGYSKLIVIRGPKSMVEAVEALIKQLDQPARQVNVEVAVESVDDNASKDLGLTYTLPNLTFNERTTSNGSPGSFQLAPLTFVAQIQALEKKGYAKTLARPSIACLDNTLGSTQVGATLKFPNVTSFTQGGQPIISVEEQQVGLQLSVRPNISSDGHVMIWINPRISAVTSFLSVNGSQYPQLSTKEVQSTMELVDGQTAVISGLIDDEMTKSMQKLPILGDIPILGELFKSRTTNHTRSQIIVTVTVRIIPRTS